MPLSKRSIGDIGENIALQYLESKGYSLVEKNYQMKGGEIDIIMKKDTFIIFIEVKYRKNEAYGHPLDTLSKTKKQSLKRTVLFYCLKKNINTEYIRIDVLGIMPNGEGGHRVWHLRGIEA